MLMGIVMHRVGDNTRFILTAERHRTWAHSDRGSNKFSFIPTIDSNLWNGTINGNVHDVRRLQIHYNDACVIH